MFSLMNTITSKNILRCFTSHLKHINFDMTISMRSLPIKPIGVRYLFTNEVLGIDRFIDLRNRITSQFGDMKENFLIRMNEYINKENTQIVFTEDLKNVIYLVNDTENEMQLLTKMLNKFQSQNESLRFGTFVFGPVVMRLIHYLQKSDMAIEMLKDPKFYAFFNQLSSITVALDLLYKQKRYHEIIDLFDHVKDNIRFETKYPRDCILLLIAACYQINTPESYKYALEVLKGAKEVGAQVTRKAVTFFAALALKQKEPDIALEVLSLATQTNYVTVRNLRIMALTDLGRFHDAFTIMRVLLNRDVPSNNEEILRETINHLKETVNTLNDKSLTQEFVQIERALAEGNHIHDTSLDTLLSIPVKPLTERRDQYKGTITRMPNRGTSSNYSMNNDNPQRQRLRHGLRDPEME